MSERESEMKLANKVAVVTGSSKGIGAAIAKQLAAEGAVTPAKRVRIRSSQKSLRRVAKQLQSVPTYRMRES